MKNKDVIRFILNAPRSAVVYLSICLNLELKMRSMKMSLIGGVLHVPAAGEGRLSSLSLRLLPDNLRSFETSLKCE